MNKSIIIISNWIEFLAREKILPSDQKSIIEPAKFHYSSLGKAFGKQIKAIEDQGTKQFEALEDLKSEHNK